MSDLTAALRILVAGHTLSAVQSANAVTEIMKGGQPPELIAAFLTALAIRPPSVEEIVGAAMAMRSTMTRIKAPPNAIDLCGTGGDGKGSYNVSTAASLIVAACGIPVAKHGNRNASSRSGTADVLEELSLPIDLPPAEAQTALQNDGFAFLFAPLYHGAMRHVASIRKELGFRTIFNLLCPLCNPAEVRFQLLGVFSDDWVEKLAYVLRDLGSTRALVVHGHDGLDELTTTTKTLAAELREGHIALRQIAPEEAGLPRAPLSQLIGGDTKHNAAALRAMLRGEQGPFRDIALLNSAAALQISGQAETLAAGTRQAAAAIDDGRVERLLLKLVSVKCNQGLCQ
jgi:anthranilate phosphoribosyltransferase